MKARERWRIALRYTFAPGRGQLSAFLSGLSMLGLVLAISLLILVLSVMNGFDKEMRQRILGLVPHITIYDQQPIEDWQQLSNLLLQHPSVTSARPFTRFDALFLRGSEVATATAIGLDVSVDSDSEHLLNALSVKQREIFLRSPRGLVLGEGIASALGASTGDALTLIVPGAGQVGDTRDSQFSRVTLVAVLTTGTELDQSLALLQLPLASRLAGIGNAVTGIRLQTRDLFDVRRVARELVSNLSAGYYATNWLMTQGNLYAAIQLSRHLIALLLFSVIAVAAFNVVSSLVLVVFDKRGCIAILRTLGASPGDIAVIFVAQGALIGLVGVILGAVLGVLGSVLAPGAVVVLEHLLDIHFLNTDVYPVAFLPSDLRLADVLLVVAVSFSMCVLAALYPARRAAALAPATVLAEDR